MRVALLLFAVLIAADVTRADDVDAPILRALQEPTLVDFTDVPVDEAIKYLSDFHGVPINLDSQALKKAGINPNAATSTLLLKNPPLCLALRAILEPNKLSFMVKDRVLTVTTIQAAKPWQKKHYPQPGDSP
jgi:hypothetical protein